MGLRAVVFVLATMLAGCATHRPTVASALMPGMPAAVELSQVVFHPQDAEQCGPAALATALNAAGVAISPVELSPLVFLPGRAGTLTVEMKAAARRFDRLPYVLEPELRAVLAQIAAGLPVLVMQNLGLAARPAWHFAVVIGFDAEREQLVLRSGLNERLTLSTRRFMRGWDLAERWAIVVLPPGDLPAEPDATRYLEAAAGLEATGRDSAAHAAYTRAAAQWPTESFAWLGLGNLAYRDEDYLTAIAAYRAALARAPDDAAARNNLAQTFADLGCLDAAREQAVEALRSARDTALEAQVAATLAALDQLSAAGACPAALAER